MLFGRFRVPTRTRTEYGTADPRVDDPTSDSVYAPCGTTAPASFLRFHAIAIVRPATVEPRHLRTRGPVRVDAPARRQHRRAGGITMEEPELPRDDLLDARDEGRGRARGREVPERGDGHRVCVEAARGGTEDGLVDTAGAPFV